MNLRLYSNLASVSHLFYRLYFPHQRIASTIDHQLKKFNCRKIVFFGALVDVAKILQSKGYQITFVEYTQEMIDEAKKVLKDIPFILSDMRQLKLKHKYDAIVLMGRIMTYMYTDADALKALQAFKNNLQNSGIIIVDNYKTSKIDQGDYFNGVVELKSKNLVVKRISTMEKQQTFPTLYRWNCIYEIVANGRKKVYRDNNHLLRAFTKNEIKNLVEQANLACIDNLPNFETRSFITIAQKI